MDCQAKKYAVLGHSAEPAILGSNFQVLSEDFRIPFPVFFGLLLPALEEVIPSVPLQFVPPANEPVGFAHIQVTVISATSGAVPKPAWLRKSKDDTRTHIKLLVALQLVHLRSSRGRCIALDGLADDVLLCNLRQLSLNEGDRGRVSENEHPIRRY